MFCSTFYCPYVKYMLKDIEALCSLSLADKDNNNTDVRCNKRKAFSIKALCRLL